MCAIYGILDLILGTIFVIMIAHIIMSWLLNFNVLNFQQQMVAALWTGLNKLLEPAYEPIRRVMPDTRPLDLAPLVAFLIIIALRSYVLPAVFPGCGVPF